MSKRTVLTALFAFGLGALAALLWRPPVQAPQPVAPQAPAASAPAPPDRAPARTAGPPQPAREPTAEPEPAREPEEPPGEEERPARVQMRVEQKLAGPLSTVPHELLGAWDEAPGSPRPGAHRTLVALVDPDTPNADLEALVRDIRQRHRDAEVLDVRIYDSQEAATQPGYLDGGALRAQHLVAELKRNDRLEYESVQVRGVAIEP